MDLNPVVIHLERAVERKALIADMEARLGCPIRIHVASDGSAGWADPAVSKAHIQPGCKVSQGDIGTVNSHLAVVYDFKRSDHEYCFVFEDDCELYCDIDTIRALIEEANSVGHWDLLYLGVNSYVNTIPTKTSLVNVKRSYGLHAMILKRSAIEKLEKADEFTRKSGKFYPSDWIYNKAVELGMIALGPKSINKYCKQKSGMLSYARMVIR